MRPYLDLLKKIREEGVDSDDRTKTGRRRIFGTQTRFDLTQGFPIVTTRGIYTKGFIAEMLWFIKGSINVKELQEQNVNIWNKWTVNDEWRVKFASEYSQGNKELYDQIMEATVPAEGTIGPMYGAMWRDAPQEFMHKLWPLVAFEDIPKDKLEHYKNMYVEFMNEAPEGFENTKENFAVFCQVQYNRSVDQLNDLVINLKKNPWSARLIVNAWIPSLLPFEQLAPQYNVLLGRGSLAPCHMCFQCFVLPPKEEGGKNRLSLQMYQRSVDTPVGAPFNIAQYALLLAMLAHVTDMEAHEFIWSTGDTHIYLDQLPLIDEQLSREPLPLPTLWLNPEVKDLFAFTINDIKILNYQHQEDKDHGMPVLKYPVAF